MLARRTRLVVVVLSLAVCASGTRAAWRIDERGACVREWTPASLARGPAAVLNAPLLPVRSALGGILVARDDPTPNPGLARRVLLPAALAVVGGGMGLVESVIWLGTGLVDTMTGGYFEVAPDEATQLGVGPITPAFSDARRAGRRRCPTEAAN